MPHATTDFKPLFAQAQTVSPSSHSIILAIFIVTLALATPLITQALGPQIEHQETPEITVFVNPVHKVKYVEATCCINGIITYLKIYENRRPDVGTYRLESRQKNPPPDPHVVELLQQAIRDYSKRPNNNITLHD